MSGKRRPAAPWNGQLLVLGGAPAIRSEGVQTSAQRGGGVVVAAPSPLVIDEVAKEIGPRDAPVRGWSEMHLSAALEARIAAIERDVAALKAQTRSTLAPDPDALLRVAAAVARTAFSAAEVLQHATVDGDLAAALEAAGLSSPRRLGKYLRRHTGAVVGDRELARIGEDRDGCVWCFVEVISAHPRTP